MAGMDRSTRDYGFDTLAVHAGAEPDALTGAVAPPIYQTSTFAQDARSHTFNMAGHTIKSLDTVASFNNGVYSGTTYREDVPHLTRRR